MKAVVLGDSHKHTSNIDVIGDMLKNMDLVIHTGDNYEDLKYIQKHYNPNAIGVKGNCDWDRDIVEERMEIIGDKRVYIAHGHHHGVKYGVEGIFYKGKEVEADLVIFGHSHVPFYAIEEDMILLNPGSISLPRRNSVRSFAIIEIQDTITVEIVEL